MPRLFSLTEALNNITLEENQAKFFGSMNQRKEDGGKKEYEAWMRKFRPDRCLEKL